MRIGLIGVPVALGALISLGEPARALDGNRTAYVYGIRCFTANAVAINRSAENPNGEQTDAIRDKAAHAHDVVYRMGSILGLSEAQIDDDFNRTQAAEARLLTSEPQYFAKTKADCIKLGLM